RRGASASPPRRGGAWPRSSTSTAWSNRRSPSTRKRCASGTRPRAFPPPSDRLTPSARRPAEPRRRSDPGGDLERTSLRRIERARRGAGNRGPPRNGVGGMDEQDEQEEDGAADRDRPHGLASPGFTHESR